MIQPQLQNEQKCRILTRYKDIKLICIWNNWVKKSGNYILLCPLNYMISKLSFDRL